MSTDALRLARELLAAVDAEMHEDWVCNSYHPKLRPAAEAMRAALKALPPQAEPAELEAIHAERRHLLQKATPTAEGARRFDILTERMRELQPAVTPEHWMAMGRIEAELKAIEGRRADRESTLELARALSQQEQKR